MRARQRLVVVSVLSAAAASLSARGTARAADRYWVGPSGGLWSNPQNWSATPGGPGGAGVPQVGDVANSTSNVNAVFDFAYSQPGLGINLTSPIITQNDPASVLVSFGDLALPRFQQPAGVGSWTQNAGTSILNRNLRLGYDTDLPPSHTQGFYTLTGGTLSIGTSLFAAHGIYTQTGGFCTIAEHAELGNGINGNPGGIAMSGGTLIVNGPIVQIRGASTFSGGHTTVRDFLSMGDGSVTLSGGTLSVGSIDVASFIGGEQMVHGGGTLLFSDQLLVRGGSFYRYNAGHLAGGSLNLAGQFLMSPGGDKLARTRGITTTGTGKVDLADNAAIVDYDPLAGSPIASIRSQVASAYNNGSWTGGGITSSLANTTTRGVGYAEASALDSVPSLFGAVDDTTVLIRLTRYGDADLDGVVNLSDFNRLAANFGTPSNAVWSQADFNYDGIVNLEDFNRLASNFGLSAAPDGPTPHDWSALASAVPEPASAWLLTLAFALKRRRRPR